MSLVFRRRENSIHFDPVASSRYWNVKKRDECQNVHQILYFEFERCEYAKDIGWSNLPIDILQDAGMVSTFACAHLHTRICAYACAYVCVRACVRACVRLPACLPACLSVCQCMYKI